MFVRIVSLVSVVALSLSSVACMAPAGNGQESGGNDVHEVGSQDSKGSTSNLTASNGAGTCDGACTHYLECKGINTSANHSTCIQSCQKNGYSADDMASLQQADCPTAIAMVEGTQQQQQQGTQTAPAGGSSAKGSECDGCAKWGDSCMWTSQSNWGQGAYSGAAADCNSYCCE